MHLTKHHGLGNDFLVALELDNPGLVPDAQMAVALCDRHTGIGADGLIFGLLHPEADAQMVLHNSDGSVAEISGNGLRCLVQALIDHPKGPDREATVLTAAGMRQAVVADDADDAGVSGSAGDTDALASGQNPASRVITAEMGEARPGPSIPPAVADFPHRAMSTIDIGNPHLVVLVEPDAVVNPGVDGPALEAHFPGGINVHFVTQPAPGELAMQIWERGAGITLACGTGACATTAAASQWGLVDDAALVRMPGGTVSVSLDSTHDNPLVSLTGTATLIATLDTPAKAGE